jgi:putative transposase
MAKDSRDLSGTSPEILGAAWFDPIEAMIRDRVRGFIENLVEAELDCALGRSRYKRAGAAMWRAEQPAIGMGVEHANCLVRSAQ